MSFGTIVTWKNELDDNMAWMKSWHHAINEVDNLSIKFTTSSSTAALA
jgi:hypothetical protein